jgi:nicotinamidase-related amidase
MSPLNLDMPRTALVLVDLMPRIVGLPTTPHSGQQVLEHCVRLADAFRDRGGLVGSSNLDEVLKERGITTVVLSGIRTSALSRLGGVLMITVTLRFSSRMP